MCGCLCGCWLLCGCLCVLGCLLARLFACKAVCCAVMFCALCDDCSRRRAPSCHSILQKQDFSTVNFSYMDFFTKKRSVTMADARDNSSQLNFKNSPARSYSVPAQGLSNLLNPLQQKNQYQLYMHAPQHINPLEQKGVFFPNQSRSGSSSVERASSSMVHDLGGVDESHQEHRTIRRCRRSDSFEMMEDG